MKGATLRAGAMNNMLLDKAGAKAQRNLKDSSKSTSSSSKSSSKSTESTESTELIVETTVLPSPINGSVDPITATPLIISRALKGGGEFELDWCF